MFDSLKMLIELLKSLKSIPESQELPLWKKNPDGTYTMDIYDVHLVVTQLSLNGLWSFTVQGKEFAGTGHSKKTKRSAQITSMILAFLSFSRDK